MFVVFFSSSMKSFLVDTVLQVYCRSSPFLCFLNVFLVSYKITCCSIPLQFLYILLERMERNTEKVCDNILCNLLKKHIAMYCVVLVFTFAMLLCIILDGICAPKIRLID